MGLILDTSVLVTVERAEKDVNHLVAELRARYGEQLAALAAVTTVEIVHGVYRAKSPEDRVRREHFVEDVLSAFHVESFTLEIARLAGKIGGSQASIGNTLPSEDLMIGATALHLDYAVVTHNFRHFERIPGLQVHRL